MTSQTSTAERLSARLTPQNQTTSSDAATPAPATRGRKVLFALLALLVAVPLGYGWLHRGLETTDDAQLDTDVVAVPSKVNGTVLRVHFTDNQRVEMGALLIELDDATAKAQVAQAEAELSAARATAEAAAASADLTYKNALAGTHIARATLSGAAASVNATSDQTAELNATLAAQTALRDKAKTDLQRAQELLASGAVSTAELDAAKTAFDSAQASMDQAAARLVTLRSSTTQARARVTEAEARLGQANETLTPQVTEARARAASASARVATAQAQLDLARLNLSYTKIHAPRAGIASKRSVSVGEVVAPGQSLVLVVPDAHESGAVWVTGNFKETQLGHMRVGQPAKLVVDAYGRELRGHVESFSGATGARFALLPPDNATGNFTKVVQRVPVRIKLDEVPPDLLLLPGLSVELTIDTRI